MDENLKNLLDTDIEKIAEDGKKRSKKRKKVLIAITTVTVFAIVICTVVIPRHVKIANGLELMAEGKYEEVNAIFEDNPDLLKECYYQWYKQQLKQGDYSVAVQIGFDELDGYKNSAELARETKYQCAIQHMNKKNYSTARYYLSQLGDYKDSAELLKKCG